MQTLKQICEEFSRGNFSVAYSYLSDDIRWDIVGEIKLEGKGDVIEFSDVMMVEMSGIVLVNTRVLADDTGIAIEGYCNYTLEDGSPAHVDYCDIYTIGNGQIKTVASYCITSKQK